MIAKMHFVHRIELDEYKQLESTIPWPGFEEILMIPKSLQKLKAPDSV